MCTITLTIIWWQSWCCSLNGNTFLSFGPDVLTFSSFLCFPPLWPFWWPIYKFGLLRSEWFEAAVVSPSDVLDVCKVTFVLFFEIQRGRDLAFIIMYISSFVTIRVAQALGTGICLLIYFPGVFWIGVVWLPVGFVFSCLGTRRFFLFLLLCISWGVV